MTVWSSCDKNCRSLSNATVKQRHATDDRDYDSELMADGGIRTPGSKERFWLNESTYENGTRRNIIERLRMLCILIMHYAKHPSSTGQTLLVLRILNL
jgi:hypothetical protein